MPAGTQLYSTPGSRERGQASMHEDPAEKWATTHLGAQNFPVKSNDPYASTKPPHNPQDPRWEPGSPAHPPKRRISKLFRAKITV